MAKLLFIKSEQAKRTKIKRRWQIACAILLTLIIAENLYLLYMV